MIFFFLPCEFNPSISPLIPLRHLGMTAGLQSGQQKDLGYGGKILRTRCLNQPFSPYRGPSSSTAHLPLPPTESQTESRPSWLLGVISGAGKLISSVLGSEQSDSSISECSSAGSSEGVYDYSPDEHEDCLLTDDGFKMRGSVTDTNVELLAIVPTSERKLVIQQLLMQDSFTSDECNKMIEIIQSRVVDFPNSGADDQTQNDIQERVTSVGSWHYFDQNANLSRTPYYSSSDRSAFSHRIYSHEAISPDCRNKAVVEAESWFEEKKLLPTPAYDQECGPCILNTDMNQYNFGSDDGSSDEIAISYMQSLTPSSSSFNTHGFETPPSSGKHFTCDMGTCLLPTSKGMKRGYVAIGSWNSKENCRTLLKAVAVEPENSTFGSAESPTRISVNESFMLSAASEQNGTNFEEKRQKLHEREFAEVRHKMDKDNDISAVNFVQHEETLIELTEAPKVAAWSSTENLHSDVMLPNDSDMSVSHKYQDSHALASADWKNYDPFHGAVVVQPINVSPAERSIQKDSDGQAKFRANDSMHMNSYSASKCVHTIADLGTLDEISHVQEGAFGSAKNKWHLAEANTMNSDIQLKSKEDPTASKSSNQAAIVAYQATLSEIMNQLVMFPLTSQSLDEPPIMLACLRMLQR
ncbi:hypothetical protein HPP92_017756 [Vanilla planifolia]|uniref:Uncharacterized protein n=1 Tax=Vanilla planifolia TaxID=51239 RepID=A0A835UNW2_VANPL|nr:hypothetical protein HPP92_017756 [Vanilla planifolia]